MACCSQITKRDGSFNRVVVCDSLFSPAQSTRTLIVDQARVGSLVAGDLVVERISCAAEIVAATGIVGNIEVIRVGNLVSLNIVANSPLLNPIRGLHLADILDADCFPPQIVRTNIFVIAPGLGGLGILGLTVVNIHPDGRIEIDPEVVFNGPLAAGVLYVRKMWFNI